MFTVRKLFVNFLQDFLNFYLHPKVTIANLIFFLSYILKYVCSMPNFIKFRPFAFISIYLPTFIAFFLTFLYSILILRLATRFFAFYTFYADYIPEHRFYGMHRMEEE